MEHIQIKKPIKIAIICLAALIAAGAVAGASYWAGLKNGAQAQTCQTCPTTVSEKGVAVKCAYKANAADAYGSYEITYTVTPAIYTDQIMAKLAYSDGSEVPDTVATLDHDVSGQKATVHCKAAFTKQVVATIYAASAPTVKAEITFDFTERISVTIPDSIAISDGKVPAITPTVTTTGGTKTVDKSVKNQTYAWNANFISWVKAKTKAHIDDIEKEGYLVDYYQNEVVGDLVGLSSFRCCPRSSRPRSTPTRSSRARAANTPTIGSIAMTPTESIRRSRACGISGRRRTPTSSPSSTGPTRCSTGRARSTARPTRSRSA
jgi:hypothetical protein